MSDQSGNNFEELDTASTVRLPVRNSVLAQIEAALLADKLQVSESQSRRKGIDPYNQATTRPDAWAYKR